MNWLPVLLALLGLFLSSCSLSAPATPLPSPPPELLVTATATATPASRALQLSPTRQTASTPTAVRAAELSVDSSMEVSPSLDTSSLPFAITVITPTATPRPPAPSDLLFLSQERLQRWRTNTKQVIVLADQVSAFSPAANGKQIALLRTKNVAQNGTQLYKLELLDFRTGQISTILPTTNRLYSPAISPDGSYIAYAEKLDNGPVTVVATDGESPPVEVGRCRQSTRRACGDTLTWSPDGQMLAWSDDRGVWGIDLTGDEQARLLVSETLAITDPKGDQTQTQVYFERLEWSPAGRYLLTSVSPKTSGVHWLAVLDTRLIRLIDLPGTYELLKRNASAAWMRDGSLIVAYSSNLNNQMPAQVKIWDLVATRDDLLLERATYALKSDILPALPDTPETPGKTWNYLPDWIAQLPSEHLFVLAVTVPDSTVSPVWFVFDSEWGGLREINELPYDTLNMVLSPSGSGSLVEGQHEQALFAMVDGSPLVDLRPLTGREAHDFTWLPVPYAQP